MIGNGKMILALLVPNIGGWVGVLLFTRKEIKTIWHKNLKRPKWTPPKWVIGLVWTSIYTSMGYASYLVYRDGAGFVGRSNLPLALYGSQMILNWAWTPLFFGKHRIGTALVDILALWINVALCVREFWKVNKTAGLILLPYLMWLCVNVALNYVIWRDNRKDHAEE